MSLEIVKELLEDNGLDPLEFLSEDFLITELIETGSVEITIVDAANTFILTLTAERSE
ncbi:hypothetical protein [Flavobacterium sp.]|jgi:hypothetical protein|uniref:hypothetical protein n=1 Tax=Flavobacterium sp. TaxID=239 RepID=UPI0037BE367D